jgi:hypothetical protein
MGLIVIRSSHGSGTSKNIHGQPNSIIGLCSF